MKDCRRHATGYLALFLFILLLSPGCGGGGGSGENNPPPSPTTTTAAATGISLHIATFNGTVNPHAQATNAWFEWGMDNTLVNPTLTTAQAIGAGSADNSVTAPITGLTLGTTYFYRVAATNASGTQKGAVTSFTTALPNSPPSVITNAATSVAISGGVLNGTVNPNELATTAVFEWGTDSNLTSFTSTTTQSLGAATTSVAITASLTNLTPGTTYYFRVVATNPAGTTKGLIASFTAVAQVPTVSTAAATSVTIDSVTLNGTVNPNGLAVSDYHFEYGTDSNLATFTSSNPQTLAAGYTGQAITASISGLISGTTYFFRVVATNPAGTSNGLIVSFITVAQAPTVSTAAATSITTSGATLNGTVNPNGLAVSDYHFEYGTDSNLATFTSTNAQTLAAGYTGQAITASISGLISGTTYYFRVERRNSAGTSNGLIVSFITVAQAPTVSTAAATSITTSGATLNGTVNPNGLAVSDYHFEYGTDSNLATFTSTNAQTLAAGYTGQAITASISGLISGTTYFFRVVATSAAGTSKGTILSFTSSSNPTPSEGIIFSKLFSTFGGAGVFSLDFHPTREYGSGGYISIRILDTPTTYFEFSTDPSRAWFIKIRKGIVVDSASFPYTYSQGGTYHIKITMDQSLSTVEAFGGTATLSTNDNSNPLVYFEVWTSDQDAYYDNIKMEPGFFDDFSSDTTGTYSTFYISGTNSTFTYDAAGQRAWVRTGP